jgi:hypothetical protein
MEQTNPFANRVVKTKKLGKNVVLQVSENEFSNRIMVDFFTTDGKIKVQKTFQNNFEGKKEAREFQKKFKNLADLKKYLRLV